MDEDQGTNSQEQGLPELKELQDVPSPVMGAQALASSVAASSTSDSAALHNLLVLEHSGSNSKISSFPYGYPHC